VSTGVEALHLAVAPHRLALAATAGRYRPGLRHGGFGSPLRHRTIRRPDRPAGWVRVEPILGGICASDRKVLQITTLGRSLLAFYGLDRQGIVPGHEVVGRVVEADRDGGWREGDRVVPEPTLSCHHKGYPRCGRCEAGDDHRCVRMADAGSAAPGLGFGFHARFGGGWGRELVVPADRLHRVPDGLDDRSAVLGEPMAVAVHAVLRDRTRAGERVLVVGPGAIGLCVTTALATLVPDAEVTVAGLGPFADDLARRAGATHLIHGSRRVLLEDAATTVGSGLRGNRLTGLVLEDGYDVVFDCVGTTQTIDDGLRALRPGGRLVLLGSSGEQPVDWSLVWHRELSVRGSGYYAVDDVPAGARRVGPGRRRTLAVALEVLAETRPGHLVTHVFRLDESVAALATAAAGPAAGAIKVAFAPHG
jgi:threonine dehydrogenase-like Zn-dependent dehydrogenase